MFIFESYDGGDESFAGESQNCHGEFQPHPTGEYKIKQKSDQAQTLAIYSTRMKSQKLVDGG